MESLLQDDIDLQDDNEIIPFKYDITSYGADFPVDGLVKRINNGDIYVPSFQRSYVWNITKASRFIESLLLGLPVPGIFLSKEQETNKLLVIDGQQRLKTLQYFYKGIFNPTGKIFALYFDNVESRFENAIYDKLDDEDRRRLDDSIIHATIIKQDEPSDDDSSIYHIFERLNTGGVLLEPQEIRASIYHGEFNDLINKMNKNPAWRSIYGKTDLRMRDQELILRFLAFYSQFEEYKKPMKEFLNKYMGKNRHLKYQSSEDIDFIFTDTIEFIHKCLGNKAFKPKKTLNAAVFDAVMVGIAQRLRNGIIKDCDEFERRYNSLMEKEDFIKTTSRGGTASEDKVRDRIILAIDAFKDVE